MKRLGTAIAIGVGLSLSLAAPGLAQTPPAASADSAVEPAAVQALQKMAAYLATLNTFEVRTVTSLDLVTESGQRITLDGTGSYKVRRPNGFVIEVATDWKKRVFLYDGKTFTMYAPELGYYATAAAPPTNIATLNVLYERYGIAFPIEDLFLWNDPKSRTPDQLSSAIAVGRNTVDGVLTDHYAYRQGDVDWQLWIEQGDRPLPRKLVIIDRSDLAQPAYTARLTWTVNPPLVDQDFAFRQAGSAKPIRLTAFDNGSQ